MQKEIKADLFMILLWYFCISIFAFIGGLFSGSHSWHKCRVDTRIEYVFPAYHLGCLMTEDLDEN